MSAPDPEFDALVADCWPRALAHWSRFLLLRPPVDDATRPAVGHIHLGTRQVGLHYRLIREKGLLESVEAILAHEVGHHVRYPCTLAAQARLLLLEKAILPLEDYSVVNLFTDLLINDALRPAFEEQLARVYQAFIGEAEWERDPAFAFYLAVYEERWQREPGSLMGPAHAAFGKAYPNYRAEAQVLGQNLFALGPNLFTQFLYFVSVVSRYVPPRVGEKPIAIEAYGCDGGEPSADDWAEALTPDAREREAVRRAEREGWIRKELAERLTDSPRDIDWPATLIQRGPLLGAAQPLKRQRVAEAEGWEVPLWQTRVEVYLDVSGSMPDPRFTRNAMTLAAQVLITGAIRAGGWARAVLYSGAPVTFWEWGRSEAELSRFLMHYVGGGTDFPFDLLQKSMTECRAAQPIRVVITDHDFHHNYEAAPENAGIFADAGRVSPHLVLMLHATGDDTGRYRQAGAQVITVTELEDYPAMAAKLAAALFEGEKHVAR